MITIVMPVKNAIPFLKDCLLSILNQSFIDWELIAIDDDSSDKSFEVLKAFSISDDRVSVYKNSGNGIIAALRTAYEHCRGDKITRMDADDIMPSNKLEVLSEILDSNGIGTLATGKVKYFSEESLGDGYLRYEKWLNELCDNQNHFDHIYYECVVASPCWMVYKKDFDNCGGFQNDLYPEDYDLCFRFYKGGLKVVSSDETLHLWRDYSYRTSRTDPHYLNQAFFELKVMYFLKLDYKKKQSLIIWGAGKKGKNLAKLLQEKECAFRWVCNNENKIGQQIFGVELTSTESLTSIENPMVLVCVSSPDAVNEISALMKMYEFKFKKNYLFFC